MAYKLQCNDFLTEFITEDLHTVALCGEIAASQQISENYSTFPPVRLSGNKPVLNASAQLSSG